MVDSSERLSRTIWLGVGLVIVLVCLTFVTSRLKPAPGHALAPLPVIGPVADFTLTNQAGKTVTLADLRGKVWLADIIFTRCPGPCARMSRQMKSIQDALPAESGAQLVSLTTDPDFDSPKILGEYGEKYGAHPERWTFLTGSKKEIGALAIGSLKLTTVETEPEERTSPEDLFVHSTIFVLVDKQARLRGVFETGGEGVEWTNVQPAILSAIKHLEHER
jgi:protein SCO1